jgi:hypothetical protein
MSGTHHTLRRLSSLIGLCALVAACASATAAADPSGRPDPWLGYAYSLTKGQPDAVTPFITDTLAPGGGSEPAAGFRFVTDTLAPGGGLAASAPAARGFDWGDAGIGAAGSAVTLLLLLGGARRLLHRRSVLAV